MKYERFDVIVKTDCKFCEKAINLLSLKGVPFTVTVCDKDPKYLEQMKLVYGHPTVPIIIGQRDKHNSELVGGSDELEKILLNE